MPHHAVMIAPHCLAETVRLYLELKSVGKLVADSIAGASSPNGVTPRLSSTWAAFRSPAVPSPIFSRTASIQSIQPIALLLSSSSSDKNESPLSEAILAMATGVRRRSAPARLAHLTACPP